MYSVKISVIVFLFCNAFILNSIFKSESMLNVIVSVDILITSLLYTIPLIIIYILTLIFIY